MEKVEWQPGYHGRYMRILGENFYLRNVLDDIYGGYELYHDGKLMGRFRDLPNADKAVRAELKKIAQDVIDSLNRGE